MIPLLLLLGTCAACVAFMIGCLRDANRDLPGHRRAMRPIKPLPRYRKD